MKFLCDLGVSSSVNAWLKENGYNAIHLSEEYLHKLPDDLVFQKAVIENRIVLTFDLDFGEILFQLHAKQTLSNHFQNAKSNTKQCHHAILNAHANHLKEGTVLLATEKRNKLRKLPM